MVMTATLHETLTTKVQIYIFWTIFFLMTTHKASMEHENPKTSAIIFCT